MTIKWLRGGYVEILRNKRKGIRLKAETDKFTFPCHLCDMRDPNNCSLFENPLCLKVDPDFNRNLYFRKDESDKNR